jgi:hypothetical protein
VSSTSHSVRLPDRLIWIDILDLVRAADGVQQLAQALDALRRTTAA